eukprot:CAMPEP_0206490588 /NCGR_PEP_ID=MMETSP0324_2-20121206/44234_1 /ASSEMBLY_ACC=CAM_ASM_000836 /TAXON_ID=2866 /ORGANISM="Crypthecodinium cohnii, Strain Seligo" /LENGTH=46 /DNA_ID= /DNA_START= /DNA_END= /DNA_ORIENTATION=
MAESAVDWSPEHNQAHEPVGGQKAMKAQDLASEKEMRWEKQNGWRA